MRINNAIVGKAKTSMGHVGFFLHVLSLEQLVGKISTRFCIILSGEAQKTCYKHKNMISTKIHASAEKEICPCYPFVGPVINPGWPPAVEPLPCICHITLSMHGPKHKDGFIEAGSGGIFGKALRELLSKGRT